MEWSEYAADSQLIGRVRKRGTLGVAPYRPHPNIILLFVFGTVFVFRMVPERTNSEVLVRLIIVYLIREWRKKERIVKCS